MARFLLAFVAVWSYAFTPIALSTVGPETCTSAEPPLASSAPVYVKIIWPIDPATPVNEKDRPVVESWIAKSNENRRQANFRAVTAWVPLDKAPFEATELWDGKFDGMECACTVGADITERKDGWIKISLRGWTPYGSEATVKPKDEPGSREVIPVTEAKTKHGVPQVAIFIGLQDK